MAARTFTPFKTRARLLELGRLRVSDLRFQLLDFALQRSLLIDEPLHLLRDVLFGAAHHGRNSMDRARGLLEAPQRAFAGDRFDAPHARGDRAFVDHFAQSDVARAPDVRAAAQFAAEARHDTTRTVSPYFSPNSAIAPVASACSMGMTLVSTSMLARICSFARRSISRSSSAMTEA